MNNRELNVEKSEKETECVTRDKRSSDKRVTIRNILNDQSKFS